MPVDELSPAEVYELVSLSIPFIETPASTGSGVLIEGGYVVTNYHVVWPYEWVWVVFPDGTELENVPVIGWDPMADLAVLGPVDVSAQPLRLENAEDTSLGSELLLVGYPAEVDLYPQPTITRGILSRFREWESLGMTYLQTDAAIAGGQSGGALVNANGEVVGISTFSFSEAGFALSASSADIMPIVEKLVSGEYTSGLGDRRLPVGRGSFEVDVDLNNYWDTRAYVLNATAGTILDLALEGTGDGWFHVSDSFGSLLEVNDNYTGVEQGVVELLIDGIHFLQVEMASGDGSNFKLYSSVRLRPLTDPDDGRTINVGETIAGNLDHFSDWDWYSLSLNEGETVRISTDSFNVDTLLYVDFEGSRSNQIVADDDSGGGLYGTNSELIYRAPHAGEFFLAVTSAVENSFGGYYLKVDKARQGSETVVVPPGPQLVDSPFGTMIVHEDPLGTFSIQASEHWIDLELNEEEGQVFYTLDPKSSIEFLVVVEDVLALGAGELTLEEYTDIIVNGVLIPSGVEDISREYAQTQEGISGIKIEMSWFGFRALRFIHVTENDFAINVTYVFPPELYDLRKGLAEYSFNTLRVH